MEYIIEDVMAKVLIVEKNNRRIAATVYGSLEGVERLTLFLHGFKGYKDWGQFPLLCDRIAEESGRPVVAMNFSHNGTTPESPTEFVDLEKFGKNTFSEELEDVYTMMVYLQELASQQVILDVIGHSRGGSTAILAASQFGPVQHVITWGGVIDVFSRYAMADYEQWQKDEVKYVYNGRTKQEMPLEIGLANDLLMQKMRYNPVTILNAGYKQFTLIHGDQDEVVDISELNYVNGASVNKVVLEGAGHTFGGSEPWTEDKLPEQSKELLKATLIALG